MSGVHMFLKAQQSTLSVSVQSKKGSKLGLFVIPPLLHSVVVFGVHDVPQCSSWQTKVQVLLFALHFHVKNLSTG